MRGILSSIIIIATIYWSFYVLQPQKTTIASDDITVFSTQKALTHVKALSKQTRYVGSKGHRDAVTYITQELQKLGLEVQTQQDYCLDQWGSLTRPKNIIAKIPGRDTNTTKKAIALMSHYDAVAHSSFGASDAASGVATILETARAYMASGKTPKNDILLIFSDAEELGLNGAELFVEHHPWAKNLAFVLNFEARGTSGPSYMLIETNQGNSKLIEAFVRAKPKYPVANSLAYSIYKMLPNDTDLTVLKEQGNIQGFNFAFIDNHFNYHSARDNYQNLSIKSLKHQASYATSLLGVMAETDLSTLKSTTDSVYFSTALGMFSYPFIWGEYLLYGAILLLLIVLFYGFKKQKLSARYIIKGLLLYLICFICCAALGYFGWQGILKIYPQYQEILQGFTYNGHYYILFFSLLSIAICFFIYQKKCVTQKTQQQINSYSIAPLLLWIVLNAFLVFNLPGASFFIIPVYFGIAILYFGITQKKSNLIAITLLSLAVVLIFSPFAQMFPVGLGLKMSIATTLVIVLIFGMLLPVFLRYSNRKNIGLLFFIGAGFYFLKAHTTSNFSKDRQKPNSLVYLLNNDTQKAYWATTDHVLDPWVKQKITNPDNHTDSLNMHLLYSKYKTPYRYYQKAETIALTPPTLEISRDTIIAGKREVLLCIIPNKTTHRIEFFTNTNTRFSHFTACGQDVLANKTSISIKTKALKKRLFSYYAADQKPIELSFCFDANQKTSLHLQSISYDLLENPAFKLQKRSTDQIPKPFIVNDASIITQTLEF